MSARPRHYTNNQGSDNVPVGLISLVLGIILLIVGFFLFTTRVQAGQGCLITRFGEVQDETMSPGLHYYNPFTMNQYCFSTRKQVYEIVSGDPKQSDSKANFVDWAISGKTAEGIDFWIMLTTQYHVPVENVGKLFQATARTDERIFEQIVKLHVRSAVPQVLNQYTADELYYTGNLREISDEVQEVLSPIFETEGLVLDYFELKRGDFDDSYEEKIREKAALSEDIKKKEQEQLLALAEAERIRIESEGAAAQRLIEAQADADSVLIAANSAAEAESTVLNARAEALQANPALLEWEKIDAIRSAGAIYLPSDVLPILDLTTSANSTAAATVQ